MKKEEVKTSEKLIDLYDGISVYKVHADLLREQDKNARIMTPVKFDRLTANINNDKRLESLPLCVKKVNQSGNEEFHIISGHHRVRAGRAAGIKDFYILNIEEDLTDSQIKSKQLSHNALNGFDDEQVLKEIYLEIDDMEERIKTGLGNNYEPDLDLKTINIDEVTLDIDFEVIDIVFIPEKKTKFDDAIRLIEKDSTVLVEKIENFEAFKQAILKVAHNDDVRNTASILSKMSEIVFEHYERLAEIQKKAENA